MPPIHTLAPIHAYMHTSVRPYLSGRHLGLELRLLLRTEGVGLIYTYTVVMDGALCVVDTSG